MSNFRSFFREYFDLMPDKESEAEVIEGIRAGAQFRGANLWVLIFAIFIASLGLNVNSTAVIIGAMLVSPLMGQPPFSSWFAFSEAMKAARAALPSSVSR